MNLHTHTRARTSSRTSSHETYNTDSSGGGGMRGAYGTRRRTAYGQDATTDNVMQASHQCTKPMSPSPCAGAARARANASGLRGLASRAACSLAPPGEEMHTWGARCAALPGCAQRSQCALAGVDTVPASSDATDASSRTGSALRTWSLAHSPPTEVTRAAD